MKSLKSHFLLVLSLFSFHLGASTLEDLMDMRATSSILVYRWSSQVALIQFHQNPGKATALQMPLTAFYKNKKPLKNLLEEQGSPLNQESLWKRLFSSPFKPHPNPSSWTPSLYVFKKLGIKVKWTVWQITLDPPFEEAPELRHFTLYTACGENLEKWGLTQNIPCWIENHDTIHKWSMFLMDIECLKPSNLP